MAKSSYTVIKTKELKKLVTKYIGRVQTNNFLEQVFAKQCPLFLTEEAFKLACEIERKHSYDAFVNAFTLFLGKKRNPYFLRKWFDGYLRFCDHFGYLETHENVIKKFLAFGGVALNLDYSSKVIERIINREAADISIGCVEDIEKYYDLWEKTFEVSIPEGVRFYLYDQISLMCFSCQDWSIDPMEYFKAQIDYFKALKYDMSPTQLNTPKALDRYYLSLSGSEPKQRVKGVGEARRKSDDEEFYN